MRVTSEPVPAVVGMAMKGTEGRLRLPDHFEVIEHVAAVGQEGGDGFAGIDGAAAAHRDDQTGVRLAGQRDAAAHQFDGRLAFDREQHRGREVRCQG